MEAYDFKVKVGDLVKHNCYKDLLGIVVEVNLNYAGTPIAVLGLRYNPYGFGKNSIIYPDQTG